MWRRIRRFYCCLSLAAISFYKLYYWYEKWVHWSDDQMIMKHRYLRDDPSLIARMKDMENVKYAAGQCDGDTKFKNIAFIKTHKTGGSTITSLINRFADLNDLEVALPKYADTRFNFPFPFHSNVVDIMRLKSKYANVICNHLVFQRREIFRVMKRKFKLVTILRNPIDQFYSLFYYGKLPRYYKLNNHENPIDSFFRNTSTYYKMLKTPNVTSYIYDIQLLLKNGMSYVLNYHTYRKSNHSFEEFIKFIDRSFHLVMITELFDESLILLKNMMCWKYMDIVYHKKLVNRSLKKKNISKFIEKNILNWNQLDLKLYNHFRNKLLKLISEQDKKKMSHELSTFRDLNELVLEYCKNGTKDLYYDILDYLEDIDEDPPKQFLVKPYCFCKKMNRSERNYINYFRKKFPPFYFNTRLIAAPRLVKGC